MRFYKRQVFFMFIRILCLKCFALRTALQRFIVEFTEAFKNRLRLSNLVDGESQSKHRRVWIIVHFGSNAESHYHQPKKTRTTNILPIYFGAGATMHAVQKRKSESNNANLFGSDYAYCEARSSRNSTSTHSHTLPCTEHAFIYISNDLPHWTFVDAKTVASLHKPRGFIFIVALSEIYVINYKDR